MNRDLRRAWIGFSVASAALLLSACSSGPAERNYSLPDTMCGLDLPENLYDPVFPPGSEKEVLDSFEKYGGLFAGRSCVIEVDGEVAIRSETTAGGDFQTVIAREGVTVEEAEGRHVAGEFEAMVWPGLAVAKAPCTVPVNSDHNMMEGFLVYLQVSHPKDDEESVEVLSRLIQPYMAAAIDGVPCEERAG
ncbi:hypothetical protein [Streptomyces sp. NRRL F-2890]|uniref:hypothetical protein n=1 Tax=Streptomyces sp. NRRL F-2890 TaxID=1463845 RepID=UPI00131A5271|nr:hypothetical protein [Streptomyces sp. NRRL F-2890]